MKKIALGIYKKDCKLLLKMTIGALAIQGFIMGFIPLCQVLLSESFDRNLIDIKTMPLSDWFPKVQAAISAVIALVAAAYWSAEERAGKHDQFLHRLPVSSFHYWTEKTAAGVTIILLTLVCQVLWFYGVAAFDVKLWIHDDLVPLNLILISTIAYLVGLPLSRLFTQSIVIVISGFIILGLLFLFGIYQTIFAFCKDFSWDGFSTPLLTYKIYYTVLAFFIVFAVLIYSFSNRKKINNQLKQPSSGFSVLFQYQMKRYRWFFTIAICLLVIPGFFLLTSPQDIMSSFKAFLTAIITPFVLILSGIVGIYTYSNQEKDGINHMLYHVPVPRLHLYWSKFLAGLVVASILSLAFTLTAAAYIHSINFCTSGNPRDFFCLLRFDIFSLLPNLFLFGLLPYVCGALFTHAIRNTFYAFLETIPIWMITLAVVFYLQYAMIKYVGFAGQFIVDFRGDLLPLVPWVLILMLIALAWGGYKAAADRTLLAGHTGARQLGVIRLFFFALAVVVILIKTGWRDLFYLLTNINIGIG